jgi:ATP/maltotriose-dependent transcriptional regulator MalT
MSEVRVAQLRMSSDETQRFVQQRFGVELTAQEAAMVCDRTEGWPAGIQLAGLSLVNEPNHSGFIAAFAGDDRNVADYLATEVLNRQPEPRRQFLLKTSVLDEFSSELCDFLLETDNSAAMLEEIERSNLFLVSLDSHRAWYRYQHLLRDWLRHEHQLALESPAIALLHRRAAQWMTDNNSPERAIGHLVKAGDVEQAAQLMSDVAAAEPGGEHAFIHPGSMESPMNWSDSIRFLPSGWSRQPLQTVTTAPRSAGSTRRRLSVSDVGITAQLAAVHAELGNWEQAETVATEALALTVRPGPQYPYNAAAHYALAEIHQHRGDTERAIVDAEQGISVSRDWVDPSYHGWGLFVMSHLMSDSNRRRQLLTEAKQCIAASNGQQRLLHRIEAAERRLARPLARATGTGMILDALT